MKVLFAVGNDQWSKTTSERYYEKYGDTLEYKNVFYFKALIDEVRKNNTYDRIVIHEDLEQYKAKDIEGIDRKLYSYIDTITDEIQDSEIIYICSDRRTKDDRFIMRLYNLGIYNLLIGDDRNINPLCDIIKKPKTKREAKEYLNINANSIGETGSIMRDDEVDEGQMMNILNYYEKIKDKPEEYVPAFEQIAEQYTKAQLKVIASLLPSAVKEKVYAEPKFRFLLGNEQVVPSAKKTVTVETNQNISEKKYSKVVVMMDIFKGKFKSKDKNEMNRNRQQSEEKRSPKDFTEDIKNETQTSNQQEVTENEVKETKIEADKQHELAEKARKEAEARMQEELAEKARKEAEAKAQQELAERARREAEIEADKQQELAERARKEAQARTQQELAERARKEAEAKAQQELAEKARKEAEAKVQQELAEKARKEAEAKAQQKLAEKARKEAEAKVQQELAEKARKEAEAKAQQELAEIAKRETTTQTILINDNTENIVNFSHADENGQPNISRENVAQNVNVINANLTTSNEISLEERKVKEEAQRLALEQEKIRKAQAELEEEKRKFREEQARIAQQEKSKFEAVQNIPNKVVYESVPIVARDYRKMVVFVGANKAGTSFMVNAVATQLAGSKISTSILDMTRDRGMYYIYNQSDKTLRKIASECMQRLSAGEDSYLPVSKYLKVYTTIPGSVADTRRGYKHKSVIDVVKNNSTVTVVDADFTTPIDYFENASEIYVVQDMDLLKMQETTAFLREMKNRNMDMKKVKIIINKYVKSILTPKKIIEGISYYKDPEMTFTDVLLNNKVSYSVVPYNMNNYVKYIEALCKETMNFKGYSTDFLQVIDEIAEQVYPRNGLMKKKGGLFK